MNLYNLIISNNFVFNKKEHLLKEFEKELKKMNINDLFILTDKYVNMKGGSFKRKLIETSFLMTALPSLCSLSLQAILYGLRGIITKGELCYMIKDLKIQDKINIEDAIKEYQDALTLKKKGHLNISEIFPSDLTGYLVHTHGGLINDPEKATLTIPKNTYIIHLTELGKLGISGSKDNKLFEILQNKKIIDEILYLLTFDFKNDYLNELDYFKDRIIYGPFSIMPNSIVSMSNIEKFNCFEYYPNLNTKTGEIQMNPKTSIDKIPLFAPFGQGIYELPIEELNDTIPKEITIDFINTKTKEIKSYNKSLKEIKSIDSNYEYYIADIPEYEGYTTSIVENKTDNYIASTSTYNKNQKKIFKEEFKKMNLEWDFKEDDKYYACTANMFDSKTPKKFETIIDITKDDKKDHLLFSELIYELRKRIDLKYGKEKKLVILTAQCRSLFDYEKDEEFVSGCVRLENTTITLMNLVERDSIEEINLEESYKKLISEYSLKDLISSFTKKSSMENTRISERIQVKAKRKK